MWTVSVQLSDEVKHVLHLIFAEGQIEPLRNDGDREVHLRCLLRHLARALGGKLPGEVYENYQPATEAFVQELRVFVSRVAINAHNVVALRNSHDDHPIDVD